MVKEKIETPCQAATRTFRIASFATAGPPLLASARLCSLEACSPPPLSGHRLGPAPQQPPPCASSIYLSFALRLPNKPRFATTHNTHRARTSTTVISRHLHPFALRRPSIVDHHDPLPRAPSLFKFFFGKFEVPRSCPHLAQDHLAQGAGGQPRSPRKVHSGCNSRLTR